MTLANRVLRTLRGTKHICPMCNVQLTKVSDREYECTNVENHRRYLASHNNKLPTQSQRGKEDE